MLKAAEIPRSNANDSVSHGELRPLQSTFSS
jgi:hypothetical protein